MGRKELPDGGEEDREGLDPYRVGSVGWGLVPAQPPPKGLVGGEYPIGDMRIVDAHDLGQVTDDELVDKVREFEERNQTVLERAVEMKEDVIAFVGEHKKGVVLVGSGLAAIFALTGYIVYRHKRKAKNQEGETTE